MKLFKNIRIFFIKLKWVLFGGNPKHTVKKINEVRGLRIVHSKTNKIRNPHYASTKRHSIKGFKKC